MTALVWPAEATPTAPSPGGAVIELRVSGQDHFISPEQILSVVSGLNDITQRP